MLAASTEGLRHAIPFGFFGRFARTDACNRRRGWSIDRAAGVGKTLMRAENPPSRRGRSTQPIGLEAHMSHHHEELVAVPSILPALSLLIPLAGALWARIKSGQGQSRPEGGGDI